MRLTLGGLISMSIIITAGGVEATTINNAADLALGLAPIFGDGAKYLLSIGLFAAGITSSITAPLAAAYVVCGCFGWSTDLTSRSFKTQLGNCYTFRNVTCFYRSKVYTDHPICSNRQWHTAPHNCSYSFMDNE